MITKTYLVQRLKRYGHRLGMSALKVGVAVVLYILGSFTLHHAMPALMFFGLYGAICVIWQINREIELFQAQQNQGANGVSQSKSPKVRAF